MSKAALDEFGKYLMKQVRDEAIQQWKMVVGGEMVADPAEREKLDQLDEKGKTVFLSLVPHVVDTVLHHLLWSLEQTDNIAIGVTAGNQRVPNIRDVSDGLAGELYSEHGWIARLSGEKV